jgi:hypothetical protein
MKKRLGMLRRKAFLIKNFYFLRIYRLIIANKVIVYLLLTFFGGINLKLT